MSEKSLKLFMDHLGSVKHAEVTLRPLTVFIGRNNTGKTYVAQALYACRQAIQDVITRPAKKLNSEEKTALKALALDHHDAQINGGSAEQEMPVQLHDYVAQTL